MTDLTLADIEAAKVLISHQRRDIGSCLCGWGVGTGDLGRSHALHVWRELQRAVLPDHDARVRVPLLAAQRIASLADALLDSLTEDPPDSPDAPDLDAAAERDTAELAQVNAILAAHRIPLRGAQGVLELAGRAVDADDARRDGAADALEWAAGRHNQPDFSDFSTEERLREWAAEVRDGTRTIPTGGGDQP